MAKNSQSEQLDRLVNAIFSRPGAAEMVANRELKALARIAAGLRGLPREDFKSNLKSELQGRATMSATASKVVPVQEMQTATPRLCFKNSARAIEFYKENFGAVEIMRLTGPGDKIGFAQLRIGNSEIMLSDEFPEYGAISPETLGGSTAKLNLRVPDVDAVARKLVAAGAKVVRPVEDQFYGERSGQFADPFGYTWIIATHTVEVSPAEVQWRWNEILKQKAMEETQQQPPAEKTEPRGKIPFKRRGFRTITPYILAPGASGFIEFLKAAFGAEERGRVPVPGGKIMHAEVKLGDSMIELSDGNEQYGPTPMTIHLTVPDPEAAYRSALRAGAMSLYEPGMQFYGEYEAGIRDPFGNEWYITPQSENYPHPTVQPYLHLHGAEKMIPFLEQAFGAKLEGVHNWPGGAIAHATIRIGDGELEIDEAFRANRQSQCHLHLYVPDTDAVYAQALRAGATSIEAPVDKPYGDRSAGVRDPWGNSWFIATHIKDVAF
jgi:PhnB protein